MKIIGRLLIFTLRAGTLLMGFVALAAGIALVIGSGAVALAPYIKHFPVQFITGATANWFRLVVAVAGAVAGVSLVGFAGSCRNAALRDLGLLLPGRRLDPTPAPRRTSPEYV